MYRLNRIISKEVTATIEKIGFLVIYVLRFCYWKMAVTIRRSAGAVASGW